MDIYFILCVIQSYCAYFVTQIVPALWTLLFDSCVLLLYPHHCGRFSYDFSTYFLYSRCIMYISCSRSRISHLSNEFWFQDLSTRVLLLLGPLSWQCKKNIHIYLYTHIHTYAYRYTCMYIHHTSIYLSIWRHIYIYTCINIYVHPYV